MKIVAVTDGAAIPLEPIDGKPTLVYWSICGLAQPIRYALEHANVDYIDVRLDAGPGAPGTDEYKGMWFGRKAAVNESVPFANLPYFMEPGGVALVQSSAILRHVARKYMGAGDLSASFDVALDQAVDFDGALTGRCYRDAASLKPYCEELAPTLAEWSRLLGDKPFLCGEAPSVVDFKLYETLRKLLIIEEEVGAATLGPCAPLRAYMARVEELLRAYRGGGGFIGRPLNNPHAGFK
jgi:glutathione S-transferase